MIKIAIFMSMGEEGGYGITKEKYVITLRTKKQETPYFTNEANKCHGVE
jgi:hypothetical protein